MQTNTLSSFCFTAIGFNVETVTYKNLKFQGERKNQFGVLVNVYLGSAKGVVSYWFGTGSTVIVN